MATDSAKIEAVFDEAAALTDRSQRDVFLEGACADDPELRRQVESLLAAHDTAGTFLRPNPNPSESTGSRIGRYKLVQPIGEGGFGVVYLAEQEQPVRRQVALKIIKHGMDTKQVIARFEAERQALAILDHPSIAKVYDGGTTDTGRPYFVMELVSGLPITKYCDEHRLTPRNRLELFVQICQAIQHAHTKGVIHRDLKPSNVLVALHDGRPVPTVIDFGIAKATGQPLSERTMFTKLGSVVGTPEYMSPEQAELNQMDVDTRSDIYSLGVLLYELLTGSTPLEHKQFKEAALFEMLRVVREVEPPRPSTRLSTSDQLPSIAASRGVEPRKLSGIVRGELDWIVMKCLEKDRNRRYETANALAMDLQRHRADQPVEACPPSAGYRLRKFARRRWRVLTAASAFVLLLVAAVVTLSIALVAVNQERQEKEAALKAEGRRRQQARAALDAMSSQVVEEWLAKQETLLPEHKQFLEQSLNFYEEFAADVGQQEDSRAGVAQAYLRVSVLRFTLGQFDESRIALERSRDLYTGLIVDFPNVAKYREELAKCYHNLSVSFMDLGRDRDAEAACLQATTLYRTLVNDFPAVHDNRLFLGKALHTRGLLLRNSARLVEAEESFVQAVSTLERLVADAPTVPSYREELARTYIDLGQLLTPTPGRLRTPDDDPGRFSEAVSFQSKAAAVYEVLATEFPSAQPYAIGLAWARESLGSTLRDGGQLPEAEKVLRQALATRKQLVVSFPAVPSYRRSLAITLNSLGILLKNSGREREAEELYSQAMVIHKQLAEDFPSSSDHQNDAAGAMVNLARLLLDRKELEGARQLLEEALPHHHAALRASPKHPAYRRFYRTNRWRLAETLLELSDHAAAAQVVSQFLEVAVEPPRDAYTCATLYAGCVRLAAQDERLVQGQRQALSATYGDRAMAALHQAVDLRAKEVTQMKTDPSLDPLRTRADFQELLAEVEVER